MYADEWQRLWVRSLDEGGGHTHVREMESESEGRTRHEVKEWGVTGRLFQGVFGIERGGYENVVQS